MNKSDPILLINPPWVSKDQNIWHGIKSAMPPLGLLSVAAYAETKGYDVKVLDIHVEKWDADQVEKYIKKLNPRVIGLSVMTATSNASNKIAKIAKRAAPNCTVVFGGVHAEAMTVECLQNAAVDVVVRGDGEETFVKILEGHDFNEIRGISFRDKNLMVKHNPASEIQKDLDKYPMPAYHLVPMDKYYPAIGAYKRLPAINMLMTRGCPGRCTFCNSARTTLRTRSAEHVVAEIEYLHKKYGIKEIQFYDDTFTVMRKNVLKFCELMKEKNLGITWAAFVRSDCFNEELAIAMKEAGCHQVLIGVESGDEEILKNIQKPIDKEKTRSTIALARKVGIDSRAAFIFGSQGETTDSLNKTINFSIELNPDIALYNIATPYPGTQLFNWAKSNGHLVTEEWSDYELSSTIMKLPTITTDEIQEMYEIAHKRFYMRPYAIWNRIKKITNIGQIKDLFTAFLFIILRVKVGGRGSVRQDWIGDTKQDYFDYAVEGNNKLVLTYKLRESTEDFESTQLIESEKVAA